MDSLVQFGRNVRAMRIKRGLKQDELALACELARSYMGEIERGLRNPSVLVLLKLKDVLQCGADELLEGIEVEWGVG